MLNTIIIDDDRQVLDSTVHNICQLPCVHILCSSVQARDCLMIMRNSHVDVAILDIEMPEQNGIDLAREINCHSPQTHIIFVTSYPTFMRDAFQVYAYDFIDKPIDYQRLAKTLQRLDRQLYGKTKNLLLTTADGDRRVQTRDIYMIEAMGKHAIVYTQREQIETRQSLKHLLNELDKAVFFKSSRSYIVNCNYVTGLSKLSRTSLSVGLRDVTFCAVLSKKNYPIFKQILHME